MKKLNKLSPFLGAFAAMAVLALLLVIYSLTRPVPMAGTKNIYIDVVYEDGVRDYYQITTEARFLFDALESIPDLQIDGTLTSNSGFIVTTINGKTADFKKDGSYWALLCGGTPCSYGVSQQAIKDGERYTFQYTKTPK